MEVESQTEKGHPLGGPALEGDRIEKRTLPRC